MNHKKPSGLLLRGLLEFALLFGVTAAGAADLPAYYPSEGFQRTVRIDALVPEEQRIDYPGLLERAYNRHRRQQPQRQR